MSVALPLQSNSILLRPARRKGFFMVSDVFLCTYVDWTAQVGLMPASATHGGALTTGETADPVSQVWPVAERVLYRQKSLLMSS